VQFAVHIEIIHVGIFGYMAVRYSCCCYSFEHVILVQELVYLKLQKGGLNDKGCRFTSNKKAFWCWFYSVMDLEHKARVLTFLSVYEQT